MMGIRPWAGALALAAGLLVGSANAQYATPPVQPTQKAAQTQQQAAKPVYDTGYYTNRDGRAVHRPERTHGNVIPAGATAQCRDGTYSFSQHRRGTCSHHGGVARWLQ
jgi:hypothetical protein